MPYSTRNGSCPFNPRSNPSAKMSSSICCTCRCSSPGPIQGAHMTCRSIHRSSSILCLNCRLYHNTFLFCDGFEIKRLPFVSVVCSFSPMLHLFELTPFLHNLRYQAC